MESIVPYEREFLLRDYRVNVSITDSLLTLDVEKEQSSQMWCGEFTKNYIEEITHKAGNFKKFAVFTKMLVSSLAEENEHVNIDVLTYADLEMLKTRRSNPSSITATSSSSSSSSSSVTSSGIGSSSSTTANNKLYAILTYSSEFDRVHYPLPLLFTEAPRPEKLLHIIRRLRDELSDINKIHNNNEDNNTSDKNLRLMLSHQRQENTELRHRLRQMAKSPGRNSSAETDKAAAIREAEQLRKELKEKVS